MRTSDRSIRANHKGPERRGRGLAQSFVASYFADHDIDWKQLPLPRLRCRHTLTTFHVLPMAALCSSFLQGRSLPFGNATLVPGVWSLVKQWSCDHLVPHSEQSVAAFNQRCALNVSAYPACGFLLKGSLASSPACRLFSICRVTCLLAFLRHFKPQPISFYITASA